MRGSLQSFSETKPDDTLRVNLSRLKSTFGNRAYMALIRRFSQNEHLRLYEVEEAAQIARVPTVALGDILYHHSDRRRLQDVVTCIREGCTIDTAGYRLERNSDRHLKDPTEMQRLFEWHPGAFQPDSGDPRSLHILPRRAALPVSHRDRSG